MREDKQPGRDAGDDRENEKDRPQRRFQHQSVDVRVERDASAVYGVDRPKLSSIPGANAGRLAIEIEGRRRVGIRRRRRSQAPFTSVVEARRQMTLVTHRDVEHPCPDHDTAAEAPTERADGCNRQKGRIL